jgi:CubicO group peptidase (beta-lactamase class C family)
MMQSEVLSAFLSERLGDYAAEFGVIGATVAIIKGDGLGEAATGLLNRSTRVAATPDSLFQIGSISKIFNATLVLRLVEQGRIGLDDPVVRHLPSFAVASEQVSKALTIRHLLTHTSGIDGEFFPDTGSDSDGIDRYVRACTGLGQVHAPGESASYCNAAPVILGALLQRLTGRSWDTLVQEEILRPLGAEHTTTDYAELPRFRVAVGHVPDRDSGELTVSKQLHLPRGMGPTGATLHCSARDLARFGKLFLDGGRTESGAQILGAETIARSLERQTDWPATPWTQIRVGLGWLLYDWDGRKVFGHDGGTIGQASFLRILPEANLVAVLLTNGGAGKNLYHALFDDILRDFAGIRLPTQPPAIDPNAFDMHRAVGRYANVLTQAEVVVENGALALKTSLRGPLADSFGDETWPLIPISPTACRVGNPATRIQDVIVFDRFDPATGSAGVASLGFRTLLRQGLALESSRH